MKQKLRWVLIASTAQVPEVGGESGEAAREPLRALELRARLSDRMALELRARLSDRFGA